MHVIALKNFSYTVKEGGALRTHEVAQGQILTTLKDVQVMTYLGCGLVTPAPLHAAAMPEGVTVLVETPSGVGEAIIPAVEVESQTSNVESDETDDTLPAPDDAPDADGDDDHDAAVTHVSGEALVSARKRGRPRKEAC